MEPVGVVRHWKGVALSSSATRMHTVLDIPRHTVHPYRDVWQLQVGFLCRRRAFNRFHWQ
jgi:hypothetical protein